MLRPNRNYSLASLSAPVFRYCSFETKFYYWESLIYARKASFAISGALLQSYGVELQCTAGIAIILVFHTLQLTKRPFTRESLNVAESSGLIICQCTLFCGLALQSPRSSEAFAVFLTFIMIAANCAFVIYIIYEFMNHSKEMLQGFAVPTLTLPTLSMRYSVKSALRSPKITSPKSPSVATVEMKMVGHSRVTSFGFAGGARQTPAGTHPVGALSAMSEGGSGKDAMGGGGGGGAGTAVNRGRAGSGFRMVNPMHGKRKVIHQ